MPLLTSLRLPLALMLAVAAMVSFSTSGHSEDAATATTENTATEAAAKPAAITREELLKPLATDMVMGDLSAPVLFIEYASLSCSHCAHFHSETLPQLQKEYIDTGKVAFIFRDFPFNEPALRGGMLARCAAKNGGEKRFHTFLKVMFAAQEKWAFSPDFRDALKKLALVGGMSDEEFEACMADKALENTLVSGLQWGADILKIDSTPTLFINGEMIKGFRSFEELKAMIDPLVK